MTIENCQGFVFKKLKKKLMHCLGNWVVYKRTLHWMYVVCSCPSLSWVMTCITFCCWKAFSSTLSTAHTHWIGIEERTCKPQPQLEQVCTWWQWCIMPCLRHTTQRTQWNKGDIWSLSKLMKRFLILKSYEERYGARRKWGWDHHGSKGYFKV